MKDDKIIQMMQAVRYLLRADPVTKVTYTRVFNWNDEDDVECKVMNFYMCENEDLPTFDVRLKRHFLPCCLTEPVTSLLSWCRFVIRGVFIRNGRLPDGISELCLPLLLRRYLDLLED